MGCITAAVILLPVELVDVGINVGRPLPPLGKPPLGELPLGGTSPGLVEFPKGAESEGTGGSPFPVDGVAGSVPRGALVCIGEGTMSCVGLSGANMVVDANEPDSISCGPRAPSADGVGVGDVTSPPKPVPVPKLPVVAAPAPVQKTPSAVVEGVETPIAVLKGVSGLLPVPTIPAGELVGSGTPVVGPKISAGVLKGSEIPVVGPKIPACVVTGESSPAPTLAAGVETGSAIAGGEQACAVAVGVTVTVTVT